jgi:hypothetical protein
MTEQRRFVAVQHIIRTLTANRAIIDQRRDEPEMTL